MPKLIPCPKCASVDVWSSSLSGGIRTECDGCGHQGPIRATADQAQAAWLAQAQDDIALEQMPNDNASRYDDAYARLGCKNHYPDADILAVINVDEERRLVNRKGDLDRVMTLDSEACETIFRCGKVASIEEVAETIKQQLIDALKSDEYNTLEYILSQAQRPVTFAFSFLDDYSDYAEAELHIQEDDYQGKETDQEIIRRFRNALTRRSKKDASQQAKYEKALPSTNR